MKIIRKKEYTTTLKSILSFIAKDSISRALNFKNQLDNKINDLVNFPYKFRQSLYYDDKDIRDLIFKGYTVPYLIDNKNQKIIILDIFKWIEK